MPSDQPVTPPLIPKSRDDSLTNMLSTIGKRETPLPGVSSASREKSKLTWQLVRPYWDKTAWWVLLAIAVMMFMWELDDMWAGSIYTGVKWLRDNVLKQFPVVPFILGVLVRHYMFRDRKRPS